MVLVVAALSLLLAAYAAAKHEYTIDVLDQVISDNIITLDEYETRNVGNSLETDLKATLKEDLPSDVLLCIEGKEKIGGSYQPSTLNLPCTNLCELIKNDTCIYPIIQEKSGNTLPVEGCPFTAGKYEVLNLQPDVPCLPDKIPGGEFWKFNVVVKSKDGQTIYYSNEVEIQFRKNRR